MGTANLSRRHYRSEKKGRDLREALRLERRLSDLRQQHLDSLVKVELPKPIRDGWERYFVVREDLRKSDDGPYLERVLRLIQNRETSNRKDFARRDYEHGGKMVAREHELGSIDAGTYWILTERMKSHFRLNARRVKTWQGERLVTEFVAACPWKFVSRARTHWRTHELVWTFDGKSEEAEINARLYGPSDWLARHSLRHYGSGRMYDEFEPDPRKLPPEYDAININEIRSALTSEAE